MKIVTGYKGEPHITSAQDRAWHQGIFGPGSYVLNIGQKLAGEIVTANEIRIMDGAISHQGCIAVIGHGTYDTLEIANGEQGKKRIDLVVARYSIDTETGEENLDLVVIEGTSTTGTPEAPVFNNGDIQAGDSPVDMPLFNVNIDGIAITSLTPRFTTIGTRVDTNNSVSSLNSAKVSKSGDTMTGALDIKKNGTTSTPSTNSYGNELMIKDTNGRAFGYLQSMYLTNGQRGVELCGIRTVGGAEKYNALRLLIGDDGNPVVALSGTNIKAAWRSAIDAVNKGGDTMGGNLHISPSSGTAIVTARSTTAEVRLVANGANTYHGVWSATLNKWLVNGNDKDVYLSGMKVTTAADARSSFGVPPTSHASTASTYGLGTTANYGHVKTYNGLGLASHTDGLALSAYQGKVLNDKITPIGMMQSAAFEDASVPASDTAYTFGNFKLAAGVWVVTCTVQWGGRAGGQRNAFLSETTGGGRISVGASSLAAPSENKNVTTQFTTILKPTAEKTYYLRGTQSTSSALTTYSRYDAVRIK